MRDYRRLIRLAPPDTAPDSDRPRQMFGEETLRLFLLAALCEDDAASAALLTTAAYAGRPCPLGLFVNVHA